MESKLKDVLVVLDDATQIIIDGLYVAHHGTMGSLPKFLDMLKQLKDLIKEEKLALPELKQLGADEVETILTSVYACVQKVIAAVPKV